jgi:diguanylate cyclase (GGDEF)-like protein
LAGDNAPVKILDYFEKQARPVILLQGFALIVIIGMIDFVTGDEIAFSVFYVLPIALIAWFTGRWPGLLASVLSAIVWFGADISTHSPYSHRLIPVWNTLIRFGFFIIITLLLSALRMALQRESELARIDHLTGAANARSFHDMLQLEIERYYRYRHPFTIAYIDLDNFKAINDRLGHSVGNQVLRMVVDVMRANVRKTDFIARLGGDEFALLFPETGQASAHSVLSKIQQCLNEQMRQHDHIVTFSIGALTCNGAPQSTDSLVRMADELMYAAKRDGKNTIRYDTYTAAASS